MFQIPNTITVLRILLVPVFAVAFVLPGEAWRLTAFVVFVIAGLSDFFDGLAARKLNQPSDFGRMLDPIADKILVGVALMMLVAEGSVSQFTLPPNPGLHSLLKLVPALIILAREILVSGLREFLAGVSRERAGVSFLAKFKTTIQMVAIGALILEPIADRLDSGVTGAGLHRAVGGGRADRGYRLRVFPREHRLYAQTAKRGRGMNVLYFAWVRQKVGRSDEVIEHTPSLRTVGDLALMLASRGGGYAEAFADMSRLRAAVNQTHVGLEATLAAGDEVAFFPPVTGG